MYPKNKQRIIRNCEVLLDAYNSGKLGDTTMPEDAHPDFKPTDDEFRLSYFTLPMSLNYQRDSFKLWESALTTFNDPETKDIFNTDLAAKMSVDQLRLNLLKHKLALQPNKHIATWSKIANTLSKNWGSLSKFFLAADNDFLKLRNIVQKDFKKDFPYLSGPKIFNYWSYIIQLYGSVKLSNSEYIEIAPDTHITKCSVILGVITDSESKSITKDELSKRWREILADTAVIPINMHSPLWFWSRNGFKYKLAG